jgi:hypothetical protein
LELDPAVYRAVHSDQIAKLARHLHSNHLNLNLTAWLTCPFCFCIRWLASSRMACRLHQVGDFRHG